MADVYTDTGVMTDGSKIKSSVLNVGDKLFLTNQSGGAAVTGDVLGLDTAHDEAFVYGSNALPYSPAFVVPSDIDTAGAAGAKSIANGAQGWVFRPGAYVPLASVSAAVSIGEYLAFSATSKKFVGTGIIANDTGIKPINAKAIALNAVGAAGQIPVLLLPLHGITSRRARVYNDAAINLTQNALTLMTFNQERYDTSGMHEGVTNPGRLTVPADLVGSAIFGIDGHITDHATITGMYVIIRLNGDTTIAKENWVAGADVQMSLSTQFRLVAGNYVELLVYTTAAGQHVNAELNWGLEFSITQIGESYGG